jgi:formylglycine-generating enzyme required for sulfatase activity
MKINIHIIRLLVLTVLVLAGFAAPAVAQVVSIPDPGLNAAVREALQKPTGPLTEQDLLSLTNLNASSRNISDVQGLESARNLIGLDLNSNSLTNLAIADALTNLDTLNLFNNHLTSFILTNGFTRLTLLDLGFNSLTQCSLPAGLTNLGTLFLEGNQLTNLNLPAGLSGLTNIDLTANGLTSFTFPADTTNLVTVLAFANQLTNLTLSANPNKLTALVLDFNRFRSLNLPAGLASLNRLTLLGNQLTNLSLRADMTKLDFLDVGNNQLSDFTLPVGLSRLSFLRLSGNKLTNFTLPSGMTNLTTVDLATNQLTTVTLPPDASNLTSLSLDGNPLTAVVLSEPIAAANLAALVTSLRARGVSVHTYSAVASLVSPHKVVANFAFTLTGPPGIYAILGSVDLAAWSSLGVASNQLGSATFTDVTANLSPQKFYRALLQSPPANMVFIPPNTFTMGSPTNELDRANNEGPQTIVTLTRGFWIGKYEVTQGEYLSVMNTNPSPFPGDLSRPVTSVSWPDATNYCAKLTQRELAAGRISAGSQYRLPTEAEWECAARAGTSTRFSYGDDLGYTNLADHAWYILNSGFMPHPVGQKLPNPWGLYDMEGNVVEWCQDWAGFLPGGIQTDPTGPASTTSGRKVTRGGAFDNFGQSSRSAERSLFNAGPFDTDTDLGFRAALVTEPQ